MRNFIYKLISFLIFISQISFSQSGWIQQHPEININNLYLNSIYFVNSSTGFITGYYPSSDSSVILKTVNGGVNWETKILKNKSHLYCITFCNSTTGFITSDSCRFLKTTNCGLNWISYSTGMTFYSNPMIKIKFINELTGFANFLDAIIRTSNGGNNWSICNIPQINYISSLSGLFMIDDNTGYSCGYHYVNIPYGPFEGFILKTTNSGINWALLEYDPNSYKSITFLNNSTGIAIGSNYNKFIKTTNSGLNWQNYDFCDTISFMNPVGCTSIGNSIYIVGTIYSSSAYIAKSSDYGNTWRNALRIFGNYYSFSDIFFVNQFTGWAVGSPGLIYKTTNGGTGINHNSQIGIESFSLSQNYPNPFNPTTTIKYQIKESGFVTLKIFDILGKEIATLVNEKQSPGTYEVNWDAGKYSSGIYFCKLIYGDYSKTKKIILFK